LIIIKKDDYEFNKSSRTVEVDPSYLKPGDNQITLRIIGYTSTGDI
jgi:hypothetical protein